MTQIIGKQVCTFPYALFSTPTFNAKAYPVEIDSGSYSKPNHFIVFSPVHYPTYVGHYKTKQAAQKKADSINALGAFIYWPLSAENAFKYIACLQHGGRPIITGGTS
jgi:hypothetical protein